MSVDPARLIFLSLLVLALGGFLIVEFRRDGGAALRAVAAWGLIFVAVIAAALHAGSASQSAGQPTCTMVPCASRTTWPPR